MRECLQPDEVEQLLAGKLSETMCEETSRHISDCTKCQQVLESRIDATGDEQGNAFLASQRTFLESPALESKFANRLLLAVQSNSVAGTPTPQVFPVIPGYEVTQFIGQGGMGAVYKARHLKLQRDDAIKIIHESGSDQAIQRFDREMAAVGKLNHQHLVRAYDAAEHQGVRYLVMEYLDGLDVGQVVRQWGQLNIADACEIARQAALGLHDAHQNGMVHRDVKPSNIMIARIGDDQPIIKVLDMGLALLAGQHVPTEGLTGTGQIMGTLEFMAPEQCGGSDPVDHRADIYALGCSLYKMLSGSAPFSAREYDSPLKFLSAMATLTPVPISELRVIPEDLSLLVTRMIARNGSERPASAVNVASELAAFTTGHNLQELLEATLETKHDAAGVSTSRYGTFTRTVDRLPADEKAPSTAKPPQRIPKWLIAAVSILLVGIAALSVVFFIKTADGVMRVEVNDPEIEVEFLEGETIITGAGKKEISLSPGQHAVRVKRGGFEFETIGFEIKERKETVLRVDWIEGQLQVKNGDKIRYPRLLQEDYPQLSTQSMSNANTESIEDWGAGFSLADDGVSALEVLTSPDYVWTSPVNLGSQINNSADNMFPTISADGQSIIYWSQTFSSNYLYETRRTKESLTFGKAMRIREQFNTGNYKTRSWLSDNGLTLFYVAAYDRHVTADSQQGWNIYSMKRDSLTSRWGKSTNLGNAVNSDEDDSRPVLSPNGLRLLFTVTPGHVHDLPATLYESSRESIDSPWTPRKQFKADGLETTYPYFGFTNDNQIIAFGVAWQTIIFGMTNEHGTWDTYNIRAPMEPSDNSCVLHPSGRALFFSSEERPGFGGKDIWITQRVKRTESD